MSSRSLDERLVVIRLWREPAGQVRMRIVDRANLPVAARRTVVAANIDAGIVEVRRILLAYAGLATNANGD